MLTGIYESGCPEAGGYTTFIRLADKFTWIKGAIVSMRDETTTTTTTSTTTTSTTTTTTSTTQDTVLYLTKTYTIQCFKANKNYQNCEKDRYSRVQTL